MKQKLLSNVLSIFILITFGCDKNKSPTTSTELKYPQQLTSSGKDFKPYWSPNGEYIAFLSVRNTYDPNAAGYQFELWLMKSDGTDQHPVLSVNDLYDGLITVAHMDWSKDSDDMVAQIYTPVGSEIWRINIDGGKARLSSIEDWAERPVYSPDGSKIGYIIQGPNPTQGSPVYKLYVSNTDFSNPVQIETGLIQDFAWKCNSNELIYSLYDRVNENYELWKSSMSGNEKMQFSSTPVSEEEPSCSTDGQYIAYSVQNIVYLTPADTFRSNIVIHNARNPKWIPNRNLLLIVSEQTSDTESYWTESWVVDLEGIIVKKIAEGKSTSINFSSNGKDYVYSLDGNIWIDQLLN